MNLRFALPAAFGITLWLTACTPIEPRIYKVAGESATASDAAEAFKAQGVENTNFLDSPPKILHWVMPTLPAKHSKLYLDRTNRRVGVQFTVDEKGMVKDPTILDSPPPELAANVLNSIMQARFEPAIKDGKPIPTRLQMHYDFKLD